MSVTQIEARRKPGRDPETVNIETATLEELRQLVVDLRDASRDGRNLAARYAELLRSVVDEYCNEFEARADDVLARLETQS